MKALFSLLVGLSSLPLIAQECLDFEDFSLGSALSGSSETISFSTTFLAQPVSLPGGGTTSGGSVSVGNAIAALGSGQALNVNNAAIEICLPGLKEVSFRFSNQGGYFNFSIDGSPVAIPANETGSLSLNGVDITITGSKPNNRLTGEITLVAQSGTFGCFSVGGQELQIDDICFLTCENPQSPDSAVPGISCVEFESLDKQGPYPFGSSYLENGILFKVKDHDGQFNSAKSSTQHLAGHLGLEWQFDHAGFTVDSDCWSGIKFNFYTKDPVIMVVNGVMVTGANLTSLHNTLFGDVLLTIIDDPDISGGGIACLTGRIESLELTGEDLYLDHFCAADCLRDCIDFEGESSGQKYLKDDTITEDGFVLEILDPLGNGEPAQISTQNLAGGGGKELVLVEGEISFGKYCFQGLTFQYGQFDDGIRLIVDESEVEVTDISDLDGLTVGGMTIEVFVVQSNGGNERGVVRMTGAASKIFLLANGVAIDRVCIDECPDPLVVAFDEEPLDEVFEEGDTFGEDVLEFEVCPLRINDVGTATITGDNQTGGTGQAVALSFATLKFDLLCASQLSFQFANFGANGGPQGFGVDVRLNINGDSSGLVQGFPELHGDTIGGASIIVTGTASSGRVTITGNIESIIVGGFNIQLDNIIQTPFQGGPQCHDFNTWNPSLTYGLFEENFVTLTDGTGAFFNSFIDLNSNFIDGTATITNTQTAGGSGRELTLNGAVMSIAPLLGDWADVSFRFREAGSAATREVSLYVNGEEEIFARIDDLDGHVFRAGTSLEVTARVLSVEENGRLLGIVKLEGILDSIYIGGEALTIDDLCGTQQPAPVYIDSWVVSVEETSPNIITYVWDIEALNVQTSDFLIRRNDDLGTFGPFSGSQRTVTSHGAGTNLYRITETQPIDTAKRFYRVALRAF
ncbi:MAG: hypothetical protein ACSHYB_18685 [Roseibacillus sp.]